MTTTEQAKQVADDLRTRINPVYAAQLGTESHERRLCAEAIESLIAENAKLRFALSNVLDVVAGKGGTTYPAWDIARAALGETK